MKKRVFNLFIVLYLLCSGSVIAGVASPEVLLAKGVEHIQNKEYESAIKSLQASLMLNPDDPRVMYQLGAAYYSLGIEKLNHQMIGFAQSAWTSAYERYSDENMMKPTLKDIIERADVVRQKLERMVELSVAIQKDENRLDSSLEYASILRFLDMGEKANVIYETLALEYQDDPRAYTQMAEIAMKSARISWAKTYYKRALDRDSQHQPAISGYKNVMSQLDALRVEGFEAMTEASH